jgi:alkylhydroperoxidase/carboxymuconolactone decarboxylase family protein YurZ
MAEKRIPIDPAELMRNYAAERGDIFPEFHLIAEHRPLTVHLLQRAASYILRDESRELSPVMRELIATCLLAARGEARFAANHVRRLYRLGVTDTVILEAAEGMAPAFGHSAISHVAQAILLAVDPGYPFGELPEGGAPAALTPFPEMELGDTAAPAPPSLADDEDWRFAAGIDPELAARSAAFADHCLGAGAAGENILPPAARLLVTVAALAVRGETGQAAALIRRGYRLGLNRRKVLEAISCAQNMTGVATTRVGIRAMRLAETASGE